MLKKSVNGSTSPTACCPVPASVPWPARCTIPQFKIRRKLINKETYWSRFADDFEERNNYVVGRSDLEIVNCRLAEQQGLGNVLELGCGNGSHSRILAPAATRLTATDFSYEMVAVSNTRLNDISNIKIEKANGHDLPYANAGYDTVFMANLLHIIPEPDKVLSESRRVLQKGGELIVISYTTEGMSFINKMGMIYRYLKTYGKPSPTARKLNLQQARDMLETNGFKISEANLIGQKSKAIFIKAEAV